MQQKSWGKKSLSLFLSCERWLYALLVKLDKIETEGYYESQHTS